MLGRIIFVTVFSVLSGIGHAEQILIVGGKNFVEQYIVARMTTLLLQKEGFLVTEKVDLQTKVIRPALMEGKIHVYWEYVATGYSALLQQEHNPGYSEDELFEVLKKYDHQKNSVLWLEKSPFQNGFALGMTKNLSKTHNVSTMSQLFELKQLIFGMHKSFQKRKDGLMNFANTYRFDPKKLRIKTVGHSAIYDLMRRGQIDVGLVYHTDPELLSGDFILLKDDQKSSLHYNAAPILLESTAFRFPQIIPALNRLSPFLSYDVMRTLNHKVKIQKIPVGTVARQFLEKEGLL